jgi:hypothetical protein
MHGTWKAFAVAGALAACGLAQQAPPATKEELAPPVRLTADGAPIDLGKLSKYAHAGPCVADVDGDGKRDLLVGDFPGAFWLFVNTGSNAKPAYKAGKKLSAGGGEAKVPVY